MRMSPTSRSHRCKRNDNLQNAASPHILQSMSPRSGCKAYILNGPNPLPRLRPRPIAKPFQVSSSLASKRKFSEDDCPHQTKKRRKETLQSSENIRGQAVKGKPLSAKPSDGVNSKNGILDRKSHIHSQNSVHEGDKSKKRKREVSLLEDTPDSQGSITKNRKLTQNNLRLLERSIVQKDAKSSKKMSSSSSINSQSISSSKRSCPTELSELSEPSATSSQAARSYAATDVRFEKALRAFNVKFARREEQPDAEDMKTILQVMEEKRDSPEPDSCEFYETLSLADSENEAMVTTRLTTLLIPLRDRPSNKHKTKDLLYRFDTQWRGFGSVDPGYLPTPKPDLCISIMRSAFTPEELRHMTSPYKDEAGFYPMFICEVKTAMQGPKVADRQNANNAVSALLADLQVQQRLGRETERKIRLITTAHNTRSQWYTGWFYVFDANGKTEWCSKLIKEINFSVEEENGFRVARRVNLNLSERVQHTILPQLHADFAGGPKLGSSSTRLLPKSHPPAGPPPYNRHVPGAEPQATSKRTKTAKRCVTRSITRPTTSPTTRSNTRLTRGTPRMVESNSLDSDRVSRQGREASQHA